MNLSQIFPRSKSLLSPETWDKLIERMGPHQTPSQFLAAIYMQNEDAGFPGFLPDLAQLEWAVAQIKSSSFPTPGQVEHLTVNPSLQLLELKWKNLVPVLFDTKEGTESKPEPGDEMVLAWRNPKTGDKQAEVAEKEDLLAIKMVLEDIRSETIAETGGLPIGAVDKAIDRAVFRGLLIRPQSLIKRTHFLTSLKSDEDIKTDLTHVFSLQWHITQACDLHCKHCYDRSDRSVLKFEKALEVLDDFRAFCRSRYVAGQVSFSGGNPLLYPKFTDLYRAAVERGLTVAILGNPAPKDQIASLAQIHHPAFYQVSLEGLRPHNDMIRGAGHFDRTLEFLKILRDLNIYAMVMLTLTKDNIQQVLPLAELLQGQTDRFTFNRLSMVGEGANLQLPDKAELRSFIIDYIEAAERNPIIGLKDNFINIILHERDMDLIGGCTGFGCGAAFNFLTLLSDGEVHACRKFPSPLGNILHSSFSEIYDSESASQYRSGTGACNTCVIRPSCGGCLANAYSHGLDIFKERDPHCFLEPK